MGDNKKEDADSYKVVTESVFIAMGVNSHEDWYGDTFDIPGVYIHTETDKYMIMLL